MAYNLTRTVTGTNIHVTDSANANVVNNKLDGYTKQNTYSGKNLLENKTKNSGTSRGITFALNSDETYTLNGTNDGTGNSTVDLVILSNPITLEAGTYYTIATGVNGVGMVGYTGSKYIGLSSKGSSSFTLTETTSMRVYLQVANGITTTFSNFKMYPIISTTPITIDDYEPYVGGTQSPNPDYPQEVEVGRGKNILKPYYSLAETTKSGVTYTPVFNDIGQLEYINVNGTATGNSNIIVGTFDALKGKRYYMSGVVGYTSSTMQLYANSTVAFPSGHRLASYNGIGNQVTQNDETNVDIRLYCYNGTSYDNVKVYPMVCTKLDDNYLPYNTIEVKSTGKNLIYDANHNKGTSTTQRGITYTVNEDDSISVSGTATANCDYYMIGASGTYPLTLEAGTYTLSGGISDNAWVRLFDGTNYYDTLSTGHIRTFTINQKTNFLVGLRIKSGTTVDDTFYPMLEKNSTATTFEPYKESTIQYKLGDNFLADKDYIENGVLHKNTRHIQLKVSDMDNSEDYPGWQNVSQVVQDYPGQNKTLGSITDYYCNIGKKSGTGVTTNPIAINTINLNNGRIWLQKAYFGLTQTQWKEQYPDLVVDVYYELAETETETLETIGQLETFEDSTTITNDLYSEMEVIYASKTDTDAFREKVYSEESLYNCILRIENDVVPTDQISSIKISSPIIDKSKDTFYVGTFVSQSLTIKFKNLEGLSIESGKRVHLEIGEYINNSYLYVPIGEFLIDDLAENYQTTCEITCLDYAVKFKPNINYSSAFVDGKITIDNLLKYICGYFGVELGTYPSVNGNVEISTYDSSVSGKQYISYIAEIKGSNAKMGRDGKLYLVPLKSPPVTTIDALKSKSWELGEKYQISQVIYQDAIRNFAYGENTHNTLFIRTDNMFITDASMVENIYNAVNGFTVYSAKCENYGDVSLDSWDVIRYTLGTDENDNVIYYDVLNNNDITYEMTIMSKVDAQISTKQQEITTNVVGGDEQTKLNIMRTEINKVTGDISLLTASTEEIKDDITENYYNITQTNELIQNASSGLTNTFTTSGGNNILRNTGLWFTNDGADSASNPYEFWTGIATRTSNDSAVNRNSIILGNTSFSQEQNVPNGEYTVSFNYRKISQVGTFYVIINDVEYTLDSTETKLFCTGEKDSETGEYITQPVNVTNNKITITFVCNANNGAEVYDLMCNSGSVRATYSQHQNETTTDTVNISKGITIYSSSIETIFKANANGIRILTLQEATVAYFTDKGLSTKEIIVENEAQICGTLVQQVGDQTWFTRM